MRKLLARIRAALGTDPLDYGGLEHLVLGLGNPGRRYAATRHNFGWLVVECLARRAGLAFRPGRGDFLAARWTGPAGPVLLVLPTTFMNRCGEAGSRLGELTGLPPARCLVVADDLELPLGRLRLRGQGGAGGHRGLASLIASWGSEEFPRLRLGIGRPAPGAEGEPAGAAAEGATVDHVLGPFAPAETAQAAAVIEAAADAVERFLGEGLARAADRVNGSLVT